MKNDILVVGNWKLNSNKSFIDIFVSRLFGLGFDSWCYSNKCTFVIAPPVIYLDYLAKVLKGLPVILGAQNVDVNLSGAFTGEISAGMLKDVGVKYVIVGHSERRIYHNESDELISKKIIVLKNEGIVPVLCIGNRCEEYSEKYNNNIGVCKTYELIICKQLESILDIIGISMFRDIVIAYEPIEYIGSKYSASISHVQNVCSIIRNYIAGYDKYISDSIIIQYGGAVGINNILQFILHSDVNGFLIGRSSLDVNFFSFLVNNFNRIEYKLKK